MRLCVRLSVYIMELCILIVVSAIAFEMIDTDDKFVLFFGKLDPIQQTSYHQMNDSNCNVNWKIRGLN